MSLKATLAALLGSNRRLALATDAEALATRLGLGDRTGIEANTADHGPDNTGAENPDLSAITHDQAEHIPPGYVVGLYERTD
ncbi:MAG: hypothetical protein FJ291_24255 [Planctomycetes bacterium]|nr:hypothetical protein [Planctomycetota bacterium]